MNPQSLNRYAYALNNPATFTDPLGLSGDCTAGTDANGNAIVNCPPTTVTVNGGGGNGICDMSDPLCDLLWSELGAMGVGGAILNPSGGRAVGGGGGTVPTVTSPPLGILTAANNAPCTAQASGFISANSAYANQIAQSTGVSATNLLGLSALESNFGKSNLATNYNSYFGLTVGSAFKGTTGVYTTSDGRKFGIYPSPGFLTSGLSFAQSFQGRRVAGVSDPAAFAQRLTTPPLAFNSEPGYASKLVLRISQVAPCQ